MFRKTFILGAMVTVVGLMAAPALARDHGMNTPSTWKPVSEIAADASTLGYTVTDVEREGAYYEVEGYDSRGAQIKIYYNPETGKPVSSPSFKHSSPQHD